MTSIELRARVEASGPAAAIFLTDEQAAQLSSARTLPVVVAVGDRSARLRVSRMGGPACVGLSKAARAALGVDIGDEVDVVISLDEGERTVDIPPVLADALAADPAAQAAFDALSHSRRKEMARSIAEARQDATRQRRLEKALAELA